jgi:PAS domain S-box-containing protein
VAVHKLLSRQLRAASANGGPVDLDALIAIIDQTYDEFDRERRLNDRAATLMEDELKAANQKAQREHDAVLAAILNNASDGMLVVRSDGTVDHANAAAERQFAAQGGGLDGRPIEGLLGTAARALAREGLSPIDAQEMSGVALDGRTFPVEYSFADLDMSGERRQLWIVRDISERKRAQREVLESRLRFQDFAESSSDCFWEMDETLAQVEISNPSELNWSSQLAALLAVSDGTPSPLRRYLTSHQKFRSRVEVPQSDGRMLHISVSGKPVFDLDGRFRGYRGTARDMTAEITAREAAQRAQRRLIEAMDAAPSAIALLDGDLNLVSGNSALRMLAPVGAIHLAPMPGRPFAEFLAKAGVMEGRSPNEFLRDVAASGQMREIVLGESWYLVAARALSEGGMVLSFSDVTVLKNRESELAEAKSAAESASRTKSQFLATMSHELRTPLNAILGFSEVIRDGVFGHDQKAWRQYADYADSIHASGKHLLSLISTILDLSKIEAGSYALDVESLDLCEIADSAVAIITPVAAKANVALRWDTPGERVLLSVDERAIRQVMLNLLSNGVKFTPTGGSVTLAVQALDEAVEFSVNDTGIGIATEHVEAAFELFRQVDSNIARRHEGTGLGLAISKRLVDLHGGTITITSEVGDGTCVRVRLPSRPAGSVPCAPAEAA